MDGYICAGVLLAFAATFAPVLVADAPAIVLLELAAAEEEEEEAAAELPVKTTAAAATEGLAPGAPAGSPPTPPLAAPVAATIPDVVLFTFSIDVEVDEVGWRSRLPRPPGAPPPVPIVCWLVTKLLTEEDALGVLATAVPVVGAGICAPN